MIFICFKGQFVHAQEWSCQTILEEKIVDHQTFQFCQNKFPWYPRPIRFIVNKSQISESKSVVLYLHGHLIGGFAPFYDKKLNNTYADFFNFYLKALSQNKNDEYPILVMPESLGNCLTFDQFFKDPQQALLFFNSINKFFPKVSEYHFSGHSGAYRALNQLAKLVVQNKLNLNVQSVGLFDAVYASMPDLMNLIKRQNINTDSFVYFNSYVVGSKQSAQKFSSLQAIEVQKMISDSSIKIFYIHRPLASYEKESLLEQHFRVLERASYIDYLNLIK